MSRTKKTSRASALATFCVKKNNLRDLQTVVFAQDANKTKSPSNLWENV